IALGISDRDIVEPAGVVLAARVSADAITARTEATAVVGLHEIPCGGRTLDRLQAARRRVPLFQSDRHLAETDVHGERVALRPRNFGFVKGGSGKIVVDAGA